MKFSHQKTLPVPVNSADAIYETACCLFDELWNHSPIRLLGIRTSKLTAENEPVQMSLLDLQEENALQQQNQKQERLNRALDQIKQKYGDSAIIRGSLLK